MFSDSWHYPRISLAAHILGLFESGLASAFVFFAPRRMGKTEFLLKDMLPVSEKNGWKTFYFSFLDVTANPGGEFVKALALFVEKNNALGKTKKWLSRIRKISGEAGGIKASLEFEPSVIQQNLRDLIDLMAKQDKFLLLLDEVQILADEKNEAFIATLRTMLDINKDHVKVIFTGSSQMGLRLMFSEAKAPFFHFGQNLSFPYLEKGFTDHMANLFHTITHRKIDKNALWEIFEKMQKVPQLLRSMIERLALHPNLVLEEAYQQIMDELALNRDFTTHWEQASSLERLLLNEIANGSANLFSEEMQDKIAKRLGLDNVPLSSVQSAMRTLMRKKLIAHSSLRGQYLIDDPNYAEWIKLKD